MNPNPNLLIQQVFEIFLADAKLLPLKALYQGSFAPLDLTNCVQIEVQLPLSQAAGGGFTNLLLSAGQVEITSPPNLGLFAVPITTNISSTLQPGTLQDIFAVFTIVSGTPINITTGLAVGTIYAITALGNTTALQWQALGLPAAVTPAVGVTFACTSAAPGVGTGVVETLDVNSPFTVPFRRCFSVFE